MEQPTIYCRRCSYPLIGKRRGTCPECGASFDPQIRRTYRQRPTRVWLTWLRRIFAIVSVLAISIFIMIGWLHYRWVIEQRTINALYGRNIGVRSAKALTNELNALIIRIGLPSYKFAVHARRRSSLSRPNRTSVPPFTASDSALLSKLRGIRHLDLSDIPIDDDSLTDLAALRQLEVLRLEYSGITDAGLSPIARFRNLQELSLRETG